MVVVFVSSRQISNDNILNKKPMFYTFYMYVLAFILSFLGALLGWLVLYRFFGPLVYGITFGLISGMMVYISLKELLPTAYRFDSTKGKLVSGCLVFGMAVMAASLILFLY
jgi:ZIP family zinc transporter